jgi:hypothetical protein
MVKPIDFINQLRDSDSYIQEIYTKGSCYQIYKILKLLYKKAKPYKVKTHYMSEYNHIITEIDGKFYDITGEVFVNNYFGIDGVYKEDLKEIEQWNFAMNNWLYKTCPNCGEEVV